VPAPVERAFENVFQLLKPGGVAVITVPYGLQPETIEHFPDLHEFKITQVNGRQVLTNITRAGATQEYDELVFHGGAGATLEMRIFSEKDLLRHLARAGFSEVEVCRDPIFKHGIWFRQPWSLPISARKPLRERDTKSAITAE
jgi:SAM-dependent methyltransferase